MTAHDRKTALKAASARIRLDGKGRIVLPACIREELELEPGSELDMTVEGKTLALRRAGRGSSLELLLSLGGKDVWGEAGRELQDMRDEWDRD